MASSSSNRHWPSMFRSKHAASRPWQPQPDMSNSPPSLVSGSATTGCSLNPSPFSAGSEERSSDPKPRWNPRPEQIRILEAIFNSGMVNPPRDEIPRIRMQLQEYGQVGDANVFYWFQNRKSRSKNKLRAAAGRAAVARACAPTREAAAPFTPPPPSPQQVQPQQLLVSPVAPTSSSSSSDRSSGSSKSVKPAAQAMSVTAAMDLLSPLAAACHQQMHYQGQPVAPAPAPAPNKVQELVATDEAVFLQWSQGSGHCLSAAELAAILGAQYMNVPVQQPPAASPAGMFLGLCNEVAAGSNTTGHRNSAGLGQYWTSGADQLVLGKSSAASNTAVAREEAHEDATKLGLLQYGFGVSAPALDAHATSAAAALLPAASAPDAVVTVASLAASTIANGAVANNQLQGLAAAVFAGAAAAAAPTGTVAVARGPAVVCIAGTSAVYSFPATHLDVTRMFGEAAVLFRYNGEAVLVDEFGVTVEPLQQGAVYCVLI